MDKERERDLLILQGLFLKVHPDHAMWLRHEAFRLAHETCLEHDIVTESVVDDASSCALIVSPKKRHCSDRSSGTSERKELTADGGVTHQSAHAHTELTETQLPDWHDHENKDVHEDHLGHAVREQQHDSLLLLDTEKIENYQCSEVFDTTWNAKPPQEDTAGAAAGAALVCTPERATMTPKRTFHRSPALSRKLSWEVQSPPRAFMKSVWKLRGHAPCSWESQDITGLV